MVDAVAIEEDLRLLLVDAARYRRLRWRGVAPAGTGHLANGQVMRGNAVDQFVDAELRHNPDTSGLAVVDLAAVANEGHLRLTYKAARMEHPMPEEDIATLERLAEALSGNPDAATLAAAADALRRQAERERAQAHRWQPLSEMPPPDPATGTGPVLWLRGEVDGEEWVAEGWYENGRWLTERAMMLDEDDDRATPSEPTHFMTWFDPVPPGLGQPEPAPAPSP